MQPCIPWNLILNREAPLYMFRWVYMIHTRCPVCSANTIFIRTLSLTEWGEKLPNTSACSEDGALSHLLRLKFNFTPYLTPLSFQNQQQMHSSTSFLPHPKFKIGSHLSLLKQNMKGKAIQQCTVAQVSLFQHSVTVFAMWHTTCTVGFGYISVISAIWSTLSGQNCGPYIRGKTWWHYHLPQILCFSASLLSVTHTRKEGGREWHFFPVLVMYAFRHITVAEYVTWLTECDIHSVTYRVWHTFRDIHSVTYILWHTECGRVWHTKHY